MILVDTSVWIRFISNRSPYAAELGRLLAAEEVAGHELVYGELLIGGRGGRGKLLAAYEHIPQTKRVPHYEVVQFVRDRRVHGRGIGWIDTHLLSSAIVAGLPFWTADDHLAVIAREFGIAYKFSIS